MSRLFGRNYRLTIQTGADQLVYEPPMQVRFSVEVWPGNAGGTAQITLYGASSDTRKVIRAKYDRISLAAGYGERMGLIFAGDIINIETGREGVDKYVRFYARTTGRAQSEAVVIGSWGPDTPQIEIIRAVAETLLLPVEFIGDFSDLSGAIKGRSLCMPAVACMNDLAELHRFKWYLTANRLVIIRLNPDGSVPESRPGEAHLISAETGMIGSPQILIQGVEVKTLLNSSIIPGDTANIQAETRNFATSEVYTIDRQQFDPTGGRGLYSVLGIKHDGDYRGDTWETAISGVRQS